MKKSSLIVLLIALVVVGSIFYWLNSDMMFSPLEKRFAEMDSELPTQKLLDSKELKSSFEKKYSGDWDIEIVEKDIRIIGDKIALPERVDEGNLEKLSKSFLDENKNLFWINSENLELRKKSVDDLSVVTYGQMYNGVPVFGSYVTLAIKKNNLVMFKSNYDSKLSISVEPSLSEEESVELAGKFLGIDLIIEEVRLVIYEGNLAYKIDFPILDKEDSDDLNSFNTKPSIFIDANSGRVLEVIENLRYAEISGEVSGHIYPIFSNELQVQMPFANEFVEVGEEIVLTDGTGNYLIEGLEGDVVLESSFSGPWAKVSNSQSSESVHSESLSVPNVHLWDWKTSGDDVSYKQVDSNVFYHVNRIHDYVSDSLGLEEMDFQMTSRVGLTGTCNAYYASPSALGFYMESESYPCESTALDAAVIYHEYGHAINERLVGVDWPYEGESGIMNEGFADYWACTMIDDPCASKYRDNDPLNPTGECTGRRCDSDFKYPDHLSEGVHGAAPLVSAIFWELREIYGADYTDNLVVDSLRLQPFNLHELAEDILIADSDDGIPENALHLDEICHSLWDNHRLFIPVCLGHTEMPIAEITYPSFDGLAAKNEGLIEVVGNVGGSLNGALQEYHLEYYDGEWTSEGTSVVGGEITGGVLGYVDVSLLEDRIYSLRVVSDDGISQRVSGSVKFMVDEYIKEGWPVLVGPRAIYGSPAIGDLNDDGVKEVFVGASLACNTLTGNLQALDFEGNLLDGWMGNIMRKSVSKPAIGDLDANGVNEVVFGDIKGDIKVYDYSGDNLWTYSISPLYLYDNIIGAPTLVDLNGNRDLEIIFGAEDGYLYVLDYLGNLVWKRQTSGEIRVSPSVADLNGDGLIEIVVLSYNLDTLEFKVYFYNADGSYFVDPINLVLENPIVYDDYYFLASSPALVDISGDENSEIIFGAPDGKLHVLDLNGQEVWTSDYLQKIFYLKSPAVGDIDGDGDLEIFITTGLGDVYGFNHDGSLLEGWPIIVGSGYTKNQASPVLYDIDGDGLLEVLTVSKGKVRVFEGDGSEIYLNNFYMKGRTDTSSNYGTLTLGDLEGDGIIDMVYSSLDTGIYVWELGSASNLGNEWSELHFDQHNTGSFNSQGIVYCGNGEIDGALEECDDGNILNGDGCSGRCGIENNWICDGEPSFCFFTSETFENLEKRGDVKYLGVSEESLIFYMPFEFFEGDLVYDYSPNPRNGIAHNLEVVEGKYGSAFYFLDDHYISVNPSLKFADLSEGTISFWIDPDSLNSYTEGLIHLYDDAYRDSLSLSLVYGRIYLFSERDDVELARLASSRSVSSADDWTHILMTQDGEGWRLYMNGVRSGFRGYDHQNYDFSEGLLNPQIDIGKYCSYDYHGKMDDLMIFDRSVSSEEALEIYNEQFDRFKSRGSFEYGVLGFEKEAITLDFMETILNNGFIDSFVQFPGGDVPIESNSDCIVLENPNDFSLRFDLSSDNSFFTPFLRDFTFSECEFIEDGCFDNSGYCSVGPEEGDVRYPAGDSDCNPPDTYCYRASCEVSEGACMPECFGSTPINEADAWCVDEGSYGSCCIVVSCESLGGVCREMIGESGTDLDLGNADCWSRFGDDFWCSVPYAPCSDLGGVCEVGCPDRRLPAGDAECEFNEDVCCEPLDEPAACSYDLRICPDGTRVGRDFNNNCEFFPCPEVPEASGLQEASISKPLRDLEIVERDTQLSPGTNWFVELWNWLFG